MNDFAAHYKLFRMWRSDGAESFVRAYTWYDARSVACVCLGVGYDEIRGGLLDEAFEERMPMKLVRTFPQGEVVERRSVSRRR